jgi:aminoglycoside phosphotransferase (APT) family kinase protein
VLRTPPPGPVDPSAHDVAREYRVMTALHGSRVPVPRTVMLCERDVPFTVSEFVEGTPYRTAAELAPLGPARTRAVVWSMVDTLVDLHAVDPRAVDLVEFGRPQGFLPRQLRRWGAHASGDALRGLHDALAASVPTSSEVSIVHGDYRLDNVLVRDDRVVAVLDWELSTLGHPLADFSYHCMAWHIPHTMGRGIGGLDPVALGIPTEAEYVKRYCERTGLADPVALVADWNFYLGYNLFRIAAILQGIARRVVDGTAASAQARQAGAGARPLAELGWSFAEKA